MAYVRRNAMGEIESVVKVVVNGVEIVRGNAHTGSLPGKVLRSGVDTRTMPINALQRQAA